MQIKTKHAMACTSAQMYGIFGFLLSNGDAGSSSTTRRIRPISIISHKIKISIVAIIYFASFAAE